MQTKSQVTAADVSALLRARNPLLWVITREEARVETYLIEAGLKMKAQVFTWDVASGCCDIAGIPQPFGGADPGDMLAGIKERSQNESPRSVYIMRDLHEWLQGPAGASTKRALRNLARSLPGVQPDYSQAIIVLSPSRDIPAELAGHCTVIDWPLPDKAEIAELLDAALAPYAGDDRVQKPANGDREAAIDAAVGLSGEEAQACYAKSIVQLRRIDPAMVSAEKKRVIAKDGLLEMFDPLPGGLDSVGGLDQLKSWLMSRAAAFSPQARAYGLPSPKGCVLVGIAGCGKSLSAKAIATAWTCPLIRFDVGAMRNKYVGESEANIRKALATIEAMGKVIVWFDEIEKALAGATQGAADGGVASDALGTLLNWMQERQGQSFVIATANDVESLPPEILRKGRFDEIWFVDLPTSGEREAILQATLRTFKRGQVDGLNTVAMATEGFTGAELAALVPDAMFAAFNDNGREITAQDLLASAKTTVPLSETAKDKISKLRTWAQGKARPATTKDTEIRTQRAASVRAVDLSN